MPNWVKNKMTVSDRRDEIFEHITGVIPEEDREKGASEKYVMDFNKIIAMPKVLLEIASPVRIVSEKEFAEFQDKLASSLANGGYRAGLPLTQAMNDELILKHGHNNWYDWAIANWGVKWNSARSEIDGGAVIFETAWETPVRVIRALSERFPDVTFNIEYADEDIGQNCGSYSVTGGIVEFQPMNDGSATEKQFAIDLWGYQETYKVDPDTGALIYIGDDEENEG